MWHTGTQTLYTKRTVLRRFALGDAHAAFEGWAGDKTLARNMGWKVHHSPAATYSMIEAWVGRYDSPENYRWAIEEKTSGILIGYAGMFCTSARGASPKDSWEIGICLRQSHRGQGYGYEVLQKVIDHAFYTVGIKKLYCRCLPENKAAAALITALGFCAQKQEVPPDQRAPQENEKVYVKHCSKEKV